MASGVGRTLNERKRMLILNVLYVLIAIAMIAMILMQRGAGAQAGSGFGAGASATVFGSRGASNFLSKATKWLAIVFFALTLYMAWGAEHSSKPQEQKQDDGVMGQAGETPAAKTPALPQAPALPAAPTPTGPALPQPGAPVQTAPAGPQSLPAAPAPAPTTGNAPAGAPQKG